MKFSHSLKFNAVPEWQDSYLNYPTLKKTVYKLQQDQLVNNGTDDQGYTVNANQTTVSELVDNFKLKNQLVFHKKVLLQTILKATKMVMPLNID